MALGIDIGTTRLRIAAATYGVEGPLVRRVVTRDIPAGYATSGEIAKPDSVAVLIHEAVEELNTRERRCVSCVGAPQALLWAVPESETSIKRAKSKALWEVEAHIDYPLRHAVTTFVPVAGQGTLLALGVVPKAVLHSRALTLQKAGMKVLAIDHEAVALRRAFPRCTMVLDIGHERASVHSFGAVVPRTIASYHGGAEVTRAIQVDLAIDHASAEKRKRRFGTRGAGEASRAALTLELARSIRLLREAEHEVQAINLVGNGSRLTGLAADIENSAGVRIDTGAPRALPIPAFPVRPFAENTADWALAVGLSLWESACAI